MEARIAAIALRQFGLITRDQLLRLGLSSRAICNRIDIGRLVVVHPGVYAIAGAPAGRDRELYAALLAVGDGAAVSHRSAGVFHGLEDVSAVRPDILIAHPQRRRLQGVAVHRTRTLLRSDVIVRRGFRVTSVPRTLLDLAGVLSFHQLEYPFDDALRRRIVTLDQLEERLERCPRRGVPGAGKLARLVADRTGRGRSESGLETRFRRRLKKFGLPEPVAQYEVRDASGRFVARVDFAYPEHRLAIELDGWYNHSGRARWENDLHRQNRLKLAGWDFLRFTGTDVDHEPVPMFNAIETLLGNPTVT